MSAFVDRPSAASLVAVGLVAAKAVTADEPLVGRDVVGNRRNRFVAHRNLVRFCHADR